MSVSNVNSSGPLDDDSMDPNDPTSIMYDPTLAEKNGAVTVDSNGKVITISQAPTDPLEDLTQAPDQSLDITKRLRKFGKPNI